ncbi:DNA translocase FtsK, partial [Bosea sp. TWI1241]|uniref:DNA translocase FtsK n=1 Tax=Bosea sp. TWI1241 TaxID=3148904 RepID=UPI003208AAAE
MPPLPAEGREMARQPAHPPRDATGEPYLPPAAMRFSRAPEQMRQRAETASLPALAEPEPQPFAKRQKPGALPDRVRYNRTPNHLLAQVWGLPTGRAEPAPAPQPKATAPAASALADVAAPLPAEPAFDPVASLPETVDDLPWTDAFAEDDEVPVAHAEAASPAPVPAVAEPAPVVADDDAFAFLSDHAFWELAPAGADDGLPPPASLPASAPVAMAAVPAPALTMPAHEPVPEPSPAPVAQAAVPAAAAPSWSMGYSVRLQIAESYAAPATPAALTYAETAAEPEEEAASEDEAPFVAEPVVAEPAAPAPAPVPAPVPVASRTFRIPTQPVTVSGFSLPPIEFLAEPPQVESAIPVEILQQNSGFLEGVLEDFNVRGEIVQACPGPVVTLYELEPAPGTKSSRVISLADDIARSMSAVSARVAV